MKAGEISSWKLGLICLYGVDGDGFSTYNKCNNVAFEGFFDKFDLMNREIKIVSFFFAIYLGILPLFFYLHATSHEHKFHKETDKKLRLLSTEVDEEFCDLCEVYVKQDIFNNSISTLNEICQCPIKSDAYSVNTFITSKQFHHLRAPPQYILA